MDNEIIKEIVRTIRKDILQNKDFIREILDGYQLEDKNIPPSLILRLMATFGSNLQMAQVKQNSPKIISDSAAAASPIALASGNIESQIVSDLLEGNNVYLMGKAGTGKTYLAKSIAKYVMGQPFYVINCSQWTSPIEIRGGQTITGYEEGVLIKAWQEGGILILDELPKLDPNTAGILNDALAEAGNQPMYDSDGKVIETTIPTITNGKGEKIVKGSKAASPDLRFRFCVIATGNTDMMNVGNKYGGNQRQDYSLVDRFAGSFYTIENDPVMEKRLTYLYVFAVADAIREFLVANDALQSISIRTMLNFNRTYEQEMLYQINSPYADVIMNNSGERVAPKTFNASIDSFKSMMEENMREKLGNDSKYRAAVGNADLQDVDIFKAQFMIRYRRNPENKNAVTEDELKDAERKVAAVQANN